MTLRTLRTIAREIEKEISSDVWPNKSACYAKPYLYAMGELNSIEDMWCWDSGRSIVLYFLSNASTWRGETARRIKAELNSMLKG